MIKVDIFNWTDPDHIKRNSWAISSWYAGGYVNKNGVASSEQAGSDNLKPEFDFGSKRNAIRQAKRFFPSLKKSKVSGDRDWFSLTDQK